MERITLILKTIEDKNPYRLLDPERQMSDRARRACPASGGHPRLTENVGSVGVEPTKKPPSAPLEGAGISITAGHTAFCVVLKVGEVVLIAVRVPVVEGVTGVVSVDRLLEPVLVGVVGRHRVSV